MHKTLVPLLLAILSVAAGPAPKAPGKKRFWTYPMPPKVKATDPLRMHPAYDVPQNPEQFVWKLAMPKGKTDIKEAPVLGEVESGRLRKIGSMPFGTEIKLDQFRSYARMHYYAVPWLGGTAWVNGMYVVPAGYAAGFPTADQ